MNTQHHHHNVRQYLQSELVRRCKANPKYSLRAFAKHLDIESSALSKLLSGKRSVSRENLKKFGDRLALDPVVMQKLRSSITETRGRSKSSANEPTETPTFREMALDHFEIISEWYHFAILELAAVDDFQPTNKWIAKSLGISLAETQSAVDRLLRTGLLKIDADGTWKDQANDMTNICSQSTSSALRLVQKQILQKAIDALENVDLESRDNTGMTMAIDTKLLPEAKKKIAKFRRELCKFLQASEQKNSVYQLGIALYPLTTHTKLRRS